MQSLRLIFGPEVLDTIWLSCKHPRFGDIQDLSLGFGLKLLKVNLVLGFKIAEKTKYV